MQISMSNNPIDKLACYIHNKREYLSGFIWRKGKQKTVECRICGDILDSHKDQYSPMQCGWHKVNKYSWICHMCFDYRNFRPFIKMVDEADDKAYEERHRKAEQIKLKAQEVIDLLKEYLPEYKETLDTYQFCTDVIYFDEDGYFSENDFRFAIIDKDEKYVLDINNSCILKSIVKNPGSLIEVANYLDEEIVKQRTFENPWSWDDAVKVIKKQIENR